MVQHPKTYFFFVGNEKYETDMANVTVAYIKSRISVLPAGSGLQVDGQGNDPDILLADENASISLEIGHGEGGPAPRADVPPAMARQDRRR